MHRDAQDAGAVDAIADRAGCSAGLVYTYFGSKEGLFDAVLAEITASTVSAIPITPDDLPGYAVRLHDANLEHPDVVRFVAWYQLERDPGATAAEPAVTHKIEAVREAQRRGLVRDDVPAETLLLAIQSIARMWVTEPQTVLRAVDPVESAEFRRESVRGAVSALINGRGPAGAPRRV
ncbi:TetR family transcriptional regulator [Actinoplanes sp. NPDC051513]|uniref:TetR family transcriptional regulator n=1 Tax=Actinoplanes sp. NPDC051513 TaxID=3363908 RepID=UPI0037B4969A